MDERTLTALQASIKHWEENLAAESVNDVALGPTDCALCGLFWKRLDNPTTTRTVSCDGCPVFAATGKHGCDGSPYEDAENAFMEWDEGEDDRRDAFRAAAQAELDFLRSLLPEPPK